MILGRKRIRNKSYTSIAGRLVFVSVWLWFGLWMLILKGRIVLTIKWDKLPLEGRLADISWDYLLLYDFTWYVLGSLWIVASVVTMVFGLRRGVVVTIKTAIAGCIWFIFIVCSLVWLGFVIVLLMDYFLWPMSRFIETPYFGIHKTLWSDLELRWLLERELYRHGFNHPGKVPVCKEDFNYILSWSGGFPEGFPKIILRLSRRLNARGLLGDYLDMTKPL